MKILVAWLIGLVCFFFWTVVLIYTGEHLYELPIYGRAMCVTILISPVLLWAVVMMYVGLI